MKLDKEVKRKAEFAGSIMEILSLAGPPDTTTMLKTEQTRHGNGM